MKCRHYHVTWDSERPHGCRIYKMKSSQLPSLSVLKETGEQCLSYEKKLTNCSRTSSSKNEKKL